jgi:AcrR family transcriptional regulator
MRNKTETRLRQGGTAVDRATVLRKVMQVLSVKGFSKTSIADLTNATGVDERTLKNVFATRKEILRAAIRFCADTEWSLAQEQLRVSLTGREAILAMLEENVRLRRHWSGYGGCLFLFNSFIVPPDETNLQDFLFEKRRSLTKHLRSRFVQSVRKGELPDDANCQALTDLCLTILGGITFRVLDATPPSLLFRSIELFVSTIGFSTHRDAEKQRVARGPTPRRARIPGQAL